LLQRAAAGLVGEGPEADPASAGAEVVQAGRELVGAAAQIALEACGMPANLLAEERAELAVEVRGAPGVVVSAALAVDRDLAVAAVQDLEVEAALVVEAGGRAPAVARALVLVEARDTAVEEREAELDMAVEGEQDLAAGAAPASEKVAEAEG
jgi:hypothetical protein